MLYPRQADAAIALVPVPRTSAWAVQGETAKCCIGAPVSLSTIPASAVSIAVFRSLWTLPTPLAKLRKFVSPH